MPATAIVYQYLQYAIVYIEIVAGATDGEGQCNFLAVVTKVMVNILYVQYFFNISCPYLRKNNYADSTTLEFITNYT